MAVASAGLYASLHLIPDNHANIPPLSFLQARYPSCRPANSVKALKDLMASENMDKMLETVYDENAVSHYMAIMHMPCYVCSSMYGTVYEPNIPHNLFQVTIRRHTLFLFNCIHGSNYWYATLRCEFHYFPGP